MKVTSTLFVILAFVTLALALPTSDYKRRKDPHKVTEKMVEYWTRPDVFPKLPVGVKEHVHKYIQKYPDYHYKGHAKPAPAAPKPKPSVANDKVRIAAPKQTKQKPAPKQKSPSGKSSKKSDGPCNNQ
jgi:hypothetical protein